LFFGEAHYSCLVFCSLLSFPRASKAFHWSEVR
jgi:hypothetical protein